MTDDFSYFMDFWVPTCGETEAFAAWCIKREQAGRANFYVMPDIEPFLDTSGRYITGRKQWRDHLKETNTIEMSMDDLKRQTERHNRLKEEQRNKPAVQTITTHVGQPVQQSEALKRVAERLHGRAMPDRKTLIRMAIEERTRK